MTIHASAEPKAPRPPETLPVDQFEFVVDLLRWIEEELRGVYNDISQGESTFKYFGATVPTTSDLNDGQLGLYNSGATWRLYVNVNGTVKLVALS